MRSGNQDNYNGKNDPDTIKKEDAMKSVKGGSLFERSGLINDQVIKNKIPWN